MGQRPAVLELVNHWQHYYQTAPQMGPSPFAEWCLAYLRLSDRIIDLGCGDGRDSALFRSKGHQVIAVDNCWEAIERARTRGLTVMLCDVAALPDMNQDVAYMRWLLHAVNEETENALLDWCSRNVHRVFIEARSDSESHPQDHYRRPINGAELGGELTARGFTSMRYEGRFSPMIGDDPLLLRVVATQ